MLTFAFEVIDIVLCDDHKTFLRPVIFIDFDYLA